MATYKLSDNNNHHKSEVCLVQVGTWKNYIQVSIRRWTAYGSSEHMPTKKGVSLNHKKIMFMFECLDAKKGDELKNDFGMFKVGFDIDGRMMLMNTGTDKQSMIILANEEKEKLQDYKEEIINTIRMELCALAKKQEQNDCLIDIDDFDTDSFKY